MSGYIDQGLAEGADLVVDGRGLELQGYEGGYFLGGSLFDRVTPDMAIYREEIFGPVLAVIALAVVTFPDVALAAWVGLSPGLCVFERTCGTALAIGWWMQPGLR